MDSQWKSDLGKTIFTWGCIITEGRCDTYIELFDALKQQSKRHNFDRRVLLAELLLRGKTEMLDRLRDDIPAALNVPVLNGEI